MLKTHEKSRIYPVKGTAHAKGITEVVLQMEQAPLTSANEIVYLVETVSETEYNRTTAEGRAAAAEAELAAEIEAHKIEMDEAQAKIAALEELLDEAQDAREQLRNANRTVHEENTVLYNALCECRRIFGDLPPEIDNLLPRIHTKPE